MTFTCATWERGVNLMDEMTLVQLANEAGLDGAALLAAATDAAIADGIFGVPTFRLDGESFWGGDRIETLLWRLDGGAIDEERLGEFLARPPLAQRPR